MYKKVAEELLEFIENSPSSFQAVDSLEEMLQSNQYERLDECQDWELLHGRKYYVKRNGSSVIAFTVPKEEVKNFKIFAAHSDSPAFKVKENPEILVDGHYVEWNVEKYGGMLCAPWFDRPLSVAGRIVIRTENGCKIKNIAIKRDLLIIPNLAIHMNRDANTGYSYNAQKDMIPLYGDETSKDTFYELLAKEAGCDKEDILSHDLYLYNRAQGSFLGAKEEFLSAPRLDDLQCVYAGMSGLMESTSKTSITMCAVLDNEEVGSGTRQGADSTFLTDTMERIAKSLGKDSVEYKKMLADSMLVSADNAHAVHPNHLDKADPTNRPYMNGGIVIKYNANQKYTTDAVSAGIMKKICEKAEIPFQSYVNRSDIAGGSTLGNIVVRHVGILAADIGLAQLSMHSSYETAGSKDTFYMKMFAKNYFETEITKICEKEYEIL